MANTIRIKRRNSGGTGAPGTLQSGELAFNDVDNTLYYGRGDNGSGVATSRPAIAGDGAFVALAGTQTITGNKTFSGTVSLGSSATATTPGTGSNDTTVATTAFVVSKTTGFGTGTVTSVGLSLPSFISVSNSPVTTSGTLTGTLAAQPANQIFAGPSIGSSAAPTFRTLVADDVPSINFLNIGGNLSLSNFRITSLSEPINASDAATKNYVDTTAQGIHTHTSCRMATAAALPTCTYANGSSGVGATLTATANGALTVDGVTVATNDRILVKNQDASQLQNGVYVVTNTGSAGAPFVLTRATDMDQASEFPASFEFVEEGSTNADSGWICTTNEPITVGTTAITFTQFSGAGQITAGNGLTKTGNTLSVLSANAARIAVSGSGVDLATVTTTTPTGSAGTSFVSAVATDGYGRVTSVTTSPAVVASTSAAGIVQLTDSASTTSSTLAATATAVKAAKDVADGALSRSSGGTMSGKITMKASDTTAPYNIPQGTQDPTSPVTGDFWNNGGNLFLRDASKNNRILWADLGNLTATVSPAQGGTGATSFTAGALLKGNGTSAILTATAGTDFVKPGTLTVGEVLLAASTTSDASLNIATGVDPTSPAAGDVWSTGTALKFRNSVSATKTFAFLDSNITGTAAGLSATLAVGFGGTGATTLTGYVKGNGTSAMTAAATIPNTDITGLGTMSTQAASNVSITGGTIDGIVLDGGTF
jgi:hypothetical protein